MEYENEQPAGAPSFLQQVLASWDPWKRFTEPQGTPSPPASQPIPTPDSTAAQLASLRHLRMVAKLHDTEFRMMEMYLNAYDSQYEGAESPSEVEVDEMDGKIAALEERLRIEGVEDVRESTRDELARALVTFEAESESSWLVIDERQAVNLRDESGLRRVEDLDYLDL
ncbi:uncharacterized protein LY89DRAFT_271408 [Mollisia scopiformis]|uniref:Uncharacterized protein n=1 Tax=Mollisia scopiformis TaxID=149040 RepID=A0A132BCR8_MOLSC|nr:uncharacterized protein LY89DRAFT_271408 [Mollisia scopiformis]KUJ10161.1 hypothetical protein LY89DRAFT_271408 [Mollisia scopiformis]